MRSTPRSGRSEAESLYGRRNGCYTRVSAPKCQFRALALCFQQVPGRAAGRYSRSNRDQSISRSTTMFLAGSRSRNRQQPCSTRAGVTHHPLLPMPKAAPFLNPAVRHQYAVGDGTNLGNAVSSGYRSTKDDATFILHSSSLRLIQTSIACLRTVTACLMSQ